MIPDVPVNGLIGLRKGLSIGLYIALLAVMQGEFSKSSFLSVSEHQFCMSMIGSLGTKECDVLFKAGVILSGGLLTSVIGFFVGRQSAPTLKELTRENTAQNS